MTKTDLEDLRGLDAHRRADAELRARLTELNLEANGRAFNDAQREEFEAISGKDGLLDQITATISELEIREKVIETVVEGSGRGVEAEGKLFGLPTVIKAPDDIFDLASYRKRIRSVDDFPMAYRDGAMRAIERMEFPTAADPSKAREQLERVITKHRDENFGAISQHVIGTSDPVYVAAWTDYIKGRSLTGQRLAVMQTYSSSDGGVSIPVEIDPTFINISDGAANPIRRISRKVTTTAKTWSAITTGGVTAAYVGERTTTGASDGAPSDLDDPTVTPVRADVSVDLTLEYLQDYGSGALLAEIGKLIADSKDLLEAEKFILGDGSGEPEGVVAAIITDTSSIVLTTTNDAFLLADIDKLIGQVPPRFRTGSQFVANLAILQKVPAFGTAGQDAGSIYDPISSRLRGYPVNEASFMDDVTTDTKHVLLLGNFDQFVVVDRLGLTTKTGDTLDSGGRPTGGTTIYAAWRNGTKVLAFNAFRLLEID
jgi:HK97 family phage major capsid protein